MHRFKLVLTLLVALPGMPVAAGVLKIDLPPETASFKPGAGAEIANAQCLICHSVDYVVMQPPLGRPLWVATVKKMREKYGAEVPDELVDRIVNYLSTYYGPETNAPTPGPGATAALPASGTALTGAAVVAKYGCLGCHNVNARINGPAYKEVAAKYRQDPKALAQIAQQIHKGGSGKWGPNLMPPFPMVTDAEIKAVATWILNLN